MSSAPRCARRAESLLITPRRARLVLFSLSVGVLIAWGCARFSSQAQTASPLVTVVSAATFAEGAIALESIAAAFGPNLATTTAQAAMLPLPTTLGGTRVMIRDSSGVERAAGLFFVAPTQVNLLIPADLATGAASIVIINSRNETARGTLQISQVAPGLFTANGSGAGPAAGLLLRVPQTGGQSSEPLAEVNAAQNRIVTRPLQLNRVNIQAERLFLVLFGTGWRRGANLSDVRAYVGGVETMVTFAGAQGEAAGLDQVNIPLDAELIAKLTGRGRVGVAISVAGFGSSNVVEIEVAGRPGPQAPQLTDFEFEGGRNAALVGETVRIKGSGFATFAPDNRVRIGALDAPVIAAQADQLTVRVPFGAETDFVTVTTPGGESRSRLLSLRASISGVVEDTNRQPIPGVTARFFSELLPNNTPIIARTNAEGVFVLPDVPVGGVINVVEIDGRTAAVTPSLPSLRIEVQLQQGRDHLFPQPISLQQPYGAGILIPRGALPGADPFRAPVQTVSFAADWLRALDEETATAEPMAALQGCGAAGEIIFALPLNGFVSPPCSIFDTGCPDRIYVNQVNNSRTPVKLPFGQFSSTIVQVAPFDLSFSVPAPLIVPNTDCLPAGATVKLFSLFQGGLFSPGRLTPPFGQFIERGTGLVSADGQSITVTGGLSDGGQFFFSIARPTATVIGRVVEPGPSNTGLPPVLAPVTGALVKLRGQTAVTDGNGAFVLRGVPVLEAGGQAGLEVTFVRATGRVERALIGDINLSAEQTRVIGDVVLSAPNTNRPPVLIVAPSLRAEEGNLTDFYFIAADADATQTVQVSLSGATLGTLINRGDGLYALRVAPGLDAAGEYMLTLTATDSSGLTTTRRVTLTVVNSNQAPVAIAQTITIDEDTPQNITLTATDADRDALRYTVLQPPQNGQLTGAAPDLRYTPNPNFFGTDSFIFRVSDGARDSAPVTVTINVRPINDAPVLTVPSEQRIAPGQTISFNISAMDVDASDAVTFMLVNPPMGATLQPVTGGNGFVAQFTWTPTMAGTYVVTFRAIDNGTPALSAMAAVAITVGAQNQGAWTPTAGPTGGTITALLANDATVFAGTANNGVYRSTDNGQTWQRASQGLPAQTPINALVALGNAVFAGTERGVYRSIDNGSSWTAANEGLGAGSLAERAVRALLVRGTRLFAGLRSGLGSSGSGLYVSADNGQSWQPITGLPNFGVTALTATSTTILVALDTLGVYRSIDDGQSWTSVGLSAPTLSGINALTARGTTIFAGGRAGLFRSDDDGRSWAEVRTELPELRIFALLINGDNLLIGAGAGVYLLPLTGPITLPLSLALRAESTNALAANNNALFAGASYRGIFRSLDGGRNWAESNAGLTNVQIYALTALGSSLFAATDAGVFATSDQGQSWQTTNNGLPLIRVFGSAILFDRVETLINDGANLYAGLAFGGVHRSRDQGRNWELASGGLPPGPLLSLGANGTTIFASPHGSIGPTQLFRSTDQGQSWTAVGAGLPPLPVVAYATLGAKLYAAAGAGVYVSTDDGLNWTAARQGLPDNIGVIALLANGPRLFAGTAGRGVFVSNDDGQSWTAANNNLPVNGIVLSLTANGANVLATVAEPFPLPPGVILSGGFCPGVGVFINGRCVVGVPQQGPVFSGPARAYFGLPSRVFISTDAGQSWAPIMSGLPDVPLTVLQSSGANVFLGTFGGGVLVRQF